MTKIPDMIANVPEMVLVKYKIPITTAIKMRITLYCCSHIRFHYFYFLMATTLITDALPMHNQCFPHIQVKAGAVSRNIINGVIIFFKKHPRL